MKCKNYFSYKTKSNDYLIRSFEQYMASDMMNDICCYIKNGFEIDEIIYNGSLVELNSIDNGIYTFVYDDGSLAWEGIALDKNYV